MARFREEFKYAIVKRMMPPKNESVHAIARETGLTEATLFNLKKNAKAKGMAVPGGETDSERWSTLDKFSIVFETATATGPNQVWMWHITWLPGPAKGIYFFLYLILDLYSRKFIAWEK